MRAHTRLVDPETLDDAPISDEFLPLLLEATRRLAEPPQRPQGDLTPPTRSSFLSARRI
jgi:hypothetical protein